MDAVTKAQKSLKDAETTLRALVSDAAASGDYASVVEIAAWARALSELLKTTPQTSAASSETRAAHGRTQERSQVAAKRIASVARSKATYPRFYRNDNRLVRIAWSKRERKEYEHKAPYSMLKALTTSMIEKGADGRIFSTDQILPILDEHGTEIPSYQAYVGIALFKHAGLIDQHGRQGYSIPALSKFKNAVEGVWRNLPEK